MPFRFDRSLGRTVLFSFAVVTFVIGTYQTVLQNDKNALRDNYWLFMLSFSCVMLYRYLGREQAPEPSAKPASAKKASRGNAGPKSAKRK
ncbi:hypothetical protein FY528_07180 [Hymenobacter lutimineralis]|uniref:Uncharacterized protein n=1 Tax=Hymenobacter lutimineralis TaxID=2606448 RepID=A0A5D6V9G2_9BACT|nr:MULTISPECIES: hypothetical protein [Hymenobacter]QIX61522.1 hypothetical protein HER32_10185 [Hymenobacter sp. BT18]TYZ11469.1 hypothetical protein FY528_07180 [Hymenobacter lutimineralis]